MSGGLNKESRKMKAVWILLATTSLFGKVSAASQPFNCADGCKTESECPANSHCVAVSQTTGEDAPPCGLCLCSAGYKTQGNECVPYKSSKSQKGSQGHVNQTTTSAGPATPSAGSGGGQRPTTTVSSTRRTQPTTQGTPPPSGPLNCADYNCPEQPGGGGGEDDNPLSIRSQLITQPPNQSPYCQIVPTSRPCNMAGGGTCYGVDCLQGKYCICANNRVDRQCSVTKSGSCSSGTGQLPPNAYQVQGKCFQHRDDPDNGDVIARHYATSFSDCVKLCQWTQGSCRAVNYVPIGGKNVCVLLSAAATKGSPLEAWLVSTPGCQYAQCAV